MKLSHVFGLALLLLGCTRHDPTATTTDVASTTTKPAPPPIPAGESIYPLGTNLVDQDGSHVTLDVYRGHPVLIAMFYGTCPAACPTLTRDIKAIEGELRPDERADLRVLMVSFDPERDQPDTLSALIEKHKVDRSRWKLASGSESDVRALAAVLGVQYRKMGNGEFSHTTKIVLLDRGGAIASQIDGLRQPSADLIAALRALPPATDG